MTTLKLKNTTTELAAVVHKIQQSIAMQEQDCETKLLAKCGRITKLELSLPIGSTSYY